MSHNFIKYFLAGITSVFSFTAIEIMTRKKVDLRYYFEKTAQYLNLSFKKIK